MLQVSKPRPDEVWTCVYRSAQSPGGTDPEAVVADRGRVAIARGRPCAACIETETAAAVDAVAAPRIQLPTPLPDVAVHVVQAKAIGLEAPDRRVDHMPIIEGRGLAGPGRPGLAPLVEDVGMAISNLTSPPVSNSIRKRYFFLSNCSPVAR